MSGLGNHHDASEASDDEVPPEGEWRCPVQTPECQPTYLANTEFIHSGLPPIKLARYVKKLYGRLRGLEDGQKELQATVANLQTQLGILLTETVSNVADLARMRRGMRHLNMEFARCRVDRRFVETIAIAVEVSTNFACFRERLIFLSVSPSYLRYTRA